MSTVLEPPTVDTAAQPPLVDGPPPGPSAPRAWQTVAMLTRQRPWLERQRRRYGPMFTVKVDGLPDFVVVTDPALIKQTFTAPPDVLYAGEQSPLRRVLGPHSLLGIDGDKHMEQRRLLLPPFKGDRMRSYEALVEEITRAEVATWPSAGEMAFAPAFQRITLRAILRAIFGASGAALTELEELVPPWTDLGSMLSRFRWLQRDVAGVTPWGRFLKLRARIDAILDDLIAEAKADPALSERTDVLALMVQATHEDGSPMGNDEIRDQLVTMMAAGHETTAHTLSWAVERLTRNPRALEALVAEVDAGEAKRYRDATIREVQRTRPVIFFAGRFVMQPFELGGHRLPVGTLIALAASLTHYDPQLFEEPDRFLPERFLDKLPGTYEWIPFGGGRRRCIGATFAHMELDVVLRTLLEQVELEPTTAPDEPWRFRGVAWTPGHGGRARFRKRAA